MDIKGVFNCIVNQFDLIIEEMQVVMCQIMIGQCIDVQIGVFLMGMWMKSEIIDEIVGVVVVMCELVDGVQLFMLKYVVDVVGIGGDGVNIFNVFLVVFFVVVVVGGKVVKYGNCVVFGKSGSVDLLEVVGIYLELIFEQVVCCIDIVGVGFMFVQVYYKVMKYVVGLCCELGLWILFNMFGLLINLVGVRYQVVGVFIQELCKLLVEVFKCFGSEYVLVVYLCDGLDEFSLVVVIYIVELKDGEVCEYEVCFEDFGIKSQILMGLEVDSLQVLLELICDVLGWCKIEVGQKVVELIVMNVGLVLYVVDLVISLYEGI